MKNIKELYVAWILIPESKSEEIKFRYATHKRMREMKYSLFASCEFSEYNLKKYMLETECQLTERLKIFCSEGKEKCIEWLNKERDAAIDRCKSDLERLEKAGIKEETE